MPMSRLGRRSRTPRTYRTVRLAGRSNVTKDRSCIKLPGMGEPTGVSRRVAWMMVLAVVAALLIGFFAASAPRASTCRIYHTVELVQECQRQK